MLHRSTPVFDRLLAQINDLPVIDCHEHADAALLGPDGYVRSPAPAEPIAALTNGYVLSDFFSAGASLAEMARYLAGNLKMPPHMRLMFPLRLFHVIRSDEPNAHDLDNIQKIGLWADRHITSLDEFLEAVFIVLRKARERGAAGLKDQSAYSRTLHYEVVSRGDAERLFNRLLADPRHALGWPEAKPLDDFLFHQYMRDDPAQQDPRLRRRLRGRARVQRRASRRRPRRHRRRPGRPGRARMAGGGRGRARRGRLALQ